MTTETEEINARFDAMIARAKLSTDLRNEEIVVKQLAWKRESDALLLEREAATEAYRVAIEANRSVIAANAALAEQSRVMIETRHTELAELGEHRRNVEAIYREGFAAIAAAVRAAFTPTIVAGSGIEDPNVRKPPRSSGVGYCREHGGYGFSGDCIECKVSGTENGSEARR
jgi:hypothetical protein